MPLFFSSFSIVGKKDSSVLYLSLGSGRRFSPNKWSSSWSLCPSMACRFNPRWVYILRYFFSVLRDTPVNSLILNLLSPCAKSLSICLSLLMSVFLLAIIPLFIIKETVKITAYFLNMRSALFWWSVCSGARWSIWSGQRWSVSTG